MATHITFRFEKQIILLFLLLTAVCFLQAQTSFISTWKTDNPGDSDSTSITIPTHPSGTYAYDVDWNNDGIFDEFQITGNVTHDFGSAGSYTIRIKGLFPRIYFNNTGDKEKLIDISQWGDIEWQSMNAAFSGCIHLNFSASDAPDLSNVSNFTSAFSGCTAFNSPIGHWDVSNVNTFYFTFQNCSAFNQPLNNWNTQSVNSMQRMFIGCTNFNQPINNWDVSKVSSFSAMFNNCKAFNQPLSDWDMSNAIHISMMFAGAENFNQAIGNWQLDNATHMHTMFHGASSFNQDIGDWDVSKVTSLASIFKGAASFNQDIGDWDVSQVTNLGWAFAGASSFDQDIGDWDVSQVTNMSYMFFHASVFNQDISDWDVGQVTGMGHAFDSATLFNQDIGDWDVGQVYQFGAMFNSAISFDQNLGNWDVSQGTHMNTMFHNVTLSTENYDSLLIGWNNLELKDSVTFTGGNSIYCAGWEARANMIAANSWSINDGGADNTLPTPICKNITIELENGTQTIDPSALDNGSYAHCSTVYFAASKTSFDCSDLGEFLDTLTVFDMLGNESTCIANVAVIDGPVNFNCPEDITVTPNSFGCQANVFWEEPSRNCNMTVSSSHESGDFFPAGTTMVTYTAIDQLGNTITCSFEVTVWNDLQISIDSLQNPLCYNTSDGQAFVSVTGGLEPYFFDWDHDGIGDNDDIEDQSGLVEGSYLLTLSDELGCSTVSALVELIHPEPLILSSTISESPNNPWTKIDLSVTGGTASYQYDWDIDGSGDFDDKEDIEVEESGVYTVIVKDTNGCTTSHEVEVIINAVGTPGRLQYVTIFPNPNEGVFVVEQGDCTEETEIEIFDINGVKVFQQFTSKCQTSVSLKDLPKGTYFLRLSSRNGTYVKPMVNSRVR